MGTEISNFSDIELYALTLESLIPEFSRDYQRAERMAHHHERRKNNGQGDSREADNAWGTLRNLERIIANDTLPTLNELIRATFRLMPEVGMKLDNCLRITLQAFHDETFDFAPFVEEMKLIRNAAIVHAMASTKQESTVDDGKQKENSEPPAELLSSVVSHTDRVLSSAVRARRTLSRMTSALAVH